MIAVKEIVALHREMVVRWHERDEVDVPYRGLQGVTRFGSRQGSRQGQPRNQVIQVNQNECFQVCLSHKLVHQGAQHRRSNPEWQPRYGERVTKLWLNSGIQKRKGTQKKKGYCENKFINNSRVTLRYLENTLGILRE